jgi:hypothetical protein
MCQGPWQDRYRLGGANQRAGQLVNDQTCGIWGDFFMVSIVDSKHITGILDQSMLKSASGPEEWPAFFTRKLDSLQRAMHAFVWTGWRTPQGIKPLQCGLTTLIIE